MDVPTLSRLGLGGEKEHAFFNLCCFDIYIFEAEILKSRSKSHIVACKLL